MHHPPYKPEVAIGASFANGGQLSYTFTDALAKPAFLAIIPGLLVGRTKVDGFYLNIGHDMLGWTLACASGYDVAQCVSPANGS